jgi:hypothetical protein
MSECSIKGLFEIIKFPALLIEWLIAFTTRIAAVIIVVDCPLNRKQFCIVASSAICTAFTAATASVAAGLLKCNQPAYSTIVTITTGAAVAIITARSMI